MPIDFVTLQGALAIGPEGLEQFVSANPLFTWNDGDIFLDAQSLLDPLSSGLQKEGVGSEQLRRSFYAFRNLVGQRNDRRLSLVRVMRDIARELRSVEKPPYMRAVQGALTLHSPTLLSFPKMAGVVSATMEERQVPTRYRPLRLTPPPKPTAVAAVKDKSATPELMRETIRKFLPPHLKKAGSEVRDLLSEAIIRAILTPSGAKILDLAGEYPFDTIRMVAALSAWDDKAGEFLVMLVEFAAKFFEPEHIPIIAKAAQTSDLAAEAFHKLVEINPALVELKHISHIVAAVRKNRRVALALAFLLGGPRLTKDTIARYARQKGLHKQRGL